MTTAPPGAAPAPERRAGAGRRIRSRRAGASHAGSRPVRPRWPVRPQWPALGRIVRRVRALLNSWQTALRIAARESRRARGRSALVVAMIAVPVLALTFAAVSYDMFTLTPAESVDRRLGAADAEVSWLADRPIRQDAAGAGWAEVNQPSGVPAAVGWSGSGPPATSTVAAVLPPGSRVVPADGSFQLRVSTDAASRRISTHRFDASDPLTRGKVRLLDGRFPTLASEVALSARAARRFRVGVGDRVQLERVGEQRVVGLVEFPDELGEVMLMGPGTGPEPVRSWLIDVPGEVNWALVRRLNGHGMLVTSRAVVLDPPDAPETEMLPALDGRGEVAGIGVIVSGLGLLEVVLLAGPAFAVGARRRRRDLALVAANGGTLAQLRRIVLADGVVLGVAGAGIGTIAGIAVAVAGRPLVEEYLSASRAGGYRFYPTALVTIAALAVAAGVLACLVPAYGAARQNVVAALTGRRGAVRSRRRWLVTGLLLIVLGGGAAAYGASCVDSDVILTGLAVVEVGLVLCTPSLVGLLSRVGRWLPPAPRIALRDTARNRAAAAPAISAVMAAVAGSVALGVFLASDDARTDAMRGAPVPPGYATLTYDFPVVEPELIPVDRIRDAARGAGLDVTEVALIWGPACPAGAERPAIEPGGSPDRAAVNRYCGLSAQIPPERRCPYQMVEGLSADQQRQARADPRCAESTGGYYGSLSPEVIDDGTLVPLLSGAHGEDLDRARATLAAGGVVVTDPRLLRNGVVTVEIIEFTEGSAPSAPATVTLPGHLLRTGLPTHRTFYSPGALARAGLASQPLGYLAATTTTPSAKAEEEFADAVRRLAPDLAVEIERGATSAERPVLIILAIAAGMITVGAAAIATGLAAADGRADLSTLAAVGASPRMRRALSLSQSGVIAGLGSLLGIAAGLGAGLAVLAALNQGYASRWPTPAPFPVTVPWTTLGILVLVPLVAMLGAGLLTRSRLPIERRRT